MGQAGKRVHVRKPIDKRIETAHKKGCLLLAKSLPTAIERLTELLDDENRETARKACVDLIKLELTRPRPHEAPAEAEPGGSLDPQLADRLLKALAEE